MEAILNTLGQCRLKEANPILREWIAQHREHPDLKGRALWWLDEHLPENREFAAALVLDPAEDAQVRAAAIRTLSKSLDDSQESLRRFVSVGFDPRLPEALRLQAAESSFDGNPAVLDLAKKSLEEVIAQDPSRKVREAARESAMAVWRAEQRRLDPEVQRVALIHGCMAAIDSLKARRKRGEITAEEAQAEEAQAEEAQAEENRLDEELDAACSRLSAMQEAADAAPEAVAEAEARQEQAYREHLANLRPEEEATSEADPDTSE